MTTVDSPSCGTTTSSLSYFFCHDKKTTIFVFTLFTLCYAKYESSRFQTHLIKGELQAYNKKPVCLSCSNQVKPSIILSQVISDVNYV